MLIIKVGYLSLKKLDKCKIHVHNLIMSTKQVGDIGEIAFTLKAKMHGFVVLSPYSSITVYDKMIDNGKDTYKIQVKTTTQYSKKNGKTNLNAYRVNTSHGKGGSKTYNDDNIDFFAIYILPENKFFIIPKSEIRVKTITLYLDKNNHKFSKYLENWSLLK